MKILYSIYERDSGLDCAYIADGYDRDEVINAAKEYYEIRQGEDGEYGNFSEYIILEATDEDGNGTEEEILLEYFVDIEDWERKYNEP